jgi:hypothetical protein
VKTPAAASTAVSDPVAPLPWIVASANGLVEVPTVHEVV